MRNECNLNTLMKQIGSKLIFYFVQHQMLQRSSCYPKLPRVGNGTAVVGLSYGLASEELQWNGVKQKERGSKSLQQVNPACEGVKLHSTPSTPTASSFLPAIQTQHQSCTDLGQPALPWCFECVPSSQANGSFLHFPSEAGGSRFQTNPHPCLCCFSRVCYAHGNMPNPSISFSTFSKLPTPWVDGKVTQQVKQRD